VARAPAPRRFNVREYYQMASAGILTEDDRVELIEGEIVEMSPIGSRHAACVGRLNRLFNTQLGERALVRVHDPVRLNERNEPEPDVALVLPRGDFYASSHPSPSDVLLIVEVADTSAAYDRSTKAPLYARAGIPEVWLVDLEHDRIEVLREPSARGYRVVRPYARGERLMIQALPQLELAVDAVLG
jgi:Uma2 family endonuclease